MAYRDYISQRVPFAPFVVIWGSIAFLFGIGSSGFGAWKEISLLVAAGCAACAFMSRVPRRILIILPILFLAGAWYYHFYFTIQNRMYSIPEGRTLVRGVVVGSVRTTRAGGEYFPFSLEEPGHGTIRVVTRTPSYPRYGDVLEEEGTFVRGASPHESSVLFANETRIIGEIRGNAILRGLHAIRSKLISLFRIMLPSQEAALAAGITLGDTAGFTFSFREAMKKSGTTHIVALSGYNIMILVGAVFGIFILFVPRRVASGITILTIIGFTIMTGAEESVVRAAGMGILFLVAKEIGRMYSVLHAICIAAVSMALYNPGVLFSPGFQLSFASVLGLVYAEPVFKEWWNVFASRSLKEKTESIQDHLFATLSAQWSVFPILILNFSSFSPISFIANILILPFIPLSMFFGFLALGIALIAPPLSYFAAWALRAILIYEETIIRGLSSFPELFSGPIFYAILLCYGFVFFLVLRYHMRRA